MRMPLILIVVVCSLLFLKSCLSYVYKCGTAFDAICKVQLFYLVNDHCMPIGRFIVEIAVVYDIASDIPVKAAECFVMILSGRS